MRFQPQARARLPHWQAPGYVPHPQRKRGPSKGSMVMMYLFRSPLLCFRIVNKPKRAWQGHDPRAFNEPVLDFLIMVGLTGPHNNT